MTPCEALGYKVGDVFIYINDDMHCPEGMELTLFKDDDTNCPLFKDNDGDIHCCMLEDVEKLSQLDVSVELDEVHHPQHYTDGEIECIDAIKAALSPEEYKGFLKGNAMKYIWRMNKKGKPPVDAKKALWYTDKLCGELDEN